MAKKVINKKGIIGSLFSKKGNIKFISHIAKTKKIANFLFYTDISNISLILEHGIRPVKDLGLKKGQEYSVWTYLEKEDSIGFEMDNSSRTHFWEWVAEAGVDLNNIATIGINWEMLAKNSKKDWTQDEVKKIIYVHEDVSVDCIEWIMVKRKTEEEKFKLYIDNNGLDIKVFLGEEGKIK